MAISYVTGTQSTSTNFNITINSGGERVLIVGTSSSNSDASIAIEGMTFAGQAMTKVRDDKITDFIRGELWYFLNPRLGTSQISVDHATFGNVAYNAIVLAGVKQSAQPDAQGGNTATGTAISADITTVADNSWIVEVLAAATAGNFTATGNDGQTQRTQNANTTHTTISTKTTTTAGAFSEDYTISPSTDLALSLASFSPSDDLGIGVFDAITVTDVPTVAVQVVQIQQFKDAHFGATDEWEATWEGQSSVAASSNAVTLQIYNVDSSTWETVDSNSSASANTDFTLSHSVTANFSDYYDSNNYITYRVYQNGVANLRTDHWNVEWTVGAATINVNDAVTVSEAVTMELNNRISVSDTITVAEAVTVSPISHINVNDSVTVAESVNVAQVYTVNVNDSVTVTDVVTNIDRTWNISVFDQIYVWEGRNAVTNHSFEDDTPGDDVIPTGWTSFGNDPDTYKGVADDLARDGTQSFKISSTIDRDTGIRINLTGLVANRSYTVSVWAKSTSEVDNGAFVVTNEQNGSGGAQTVANNWSGEFEGRREITWTPTTTSWEVLLGMGAFGSPTDGTVWFDDVQVGVFEKVEITSNISVSDSITITDVPTLFLPHLAVNVFDTVSIIEFFDPENVLSITAIETITVTDVPTVTNTQLGGISVSDSITVTELVQLTKILDISVSDSITVTEFVDPEANNFISVNDAITVSEAVTLTRVSNISVFDAITVTESVTVANAQLGGISVNDTITVSESVTVELTSFINVNDEVAVTDVPIMGTPGGGFLVFDAITVSEFVNVAIVNNISVFDSVTVSEFVQLDYTSAISVNDEVTITEFVKVERTSNISVFDSITVTDVPTIFLPHLAVNVFDTVSLIEFFDPENVLSLTAIDTITVSEFVAIENTQLGDITISDSISVSEFIKVELNSDLSVSDDITVVDAPSVTLVSLINVHDNVAVVELIYETTIVVNVSVSDSITVDESVVLIQAYGINVSDSITVTDVITNITNTQLGGISVVDTVMITEFAGVTEALHAFTFDSITVTDVVTNIGFVIYRAPKFIFVDGQLCMLILESTIPHYTRL